MLAWIAALAHLVAAESPAEPPDAKFVVPLYTSRPTDGMRILSCRHWLGWPSGTSWRMGRMQDGSTWWDTALGVSYAKLVAEGDDFLARVCVGTELSSEGYWRLVDRPIGVLSARYEAGVAMLEPGSSFKAAVLTDYYPLEGIKVSFGFDLARRRWIVDWSYSDRFDE